MKGARTELEERRIKTPMIQDEKSQRHQATISFPFEKSRNSFRSCHIDRFNFMQT